MSGNNLMLRDALALLEYASSRGVFKLNHYSLVSGTHGSLFPVCKSESAVSAPVESLKNLVKLLEYAADNNGFELPNYKDVLTILSYLNEEIEKQTKN